MNQTEERTSDMRNTVTVTFDDDVAEWIVRSIRFRTIDVSRFVNTVMREGHKLYSPGKSLRQANDEAWLRDNRPRVTLDTEPRGQ